MMGVRAKQAERARPQPFISQAPMSPEALIASGAEIIADYLDPDSGRSEHEAILEMMRLFDNPTAIEALDNEMARRAGGRDADGWH